MPVRVDLTKLRDDVEHHVEEEESELLPKLEWALDKAALSTMAGQIERAKKQAGVEGRPKMSKEELAEAKRAQ